jgi:FPC/CPF motif-containing protein YcgG
MIWDEVLTRNDRREYGSIWSSQRRRRSLVTEYAADSVEEGFAEAIAAYIRTPEKLRRRDLDSWQFVDDLAHLNPDPEPQDASHGKQ